jgi:hypothetical protein
MTIFVRTTRISCAVAHYNHWYTSRILGLPTENRAFKLFERVLPDGAPERN